MSQELNMGGAVVAPFNVKEGKIIITDAATAHGTIKAPVLESELHKGDLVELDGEMTVKAHSAGVPIGYIYNVPKWGVEPREDYTQATAITAGMLREAAVQTFFKQIITVDAKAGQGIAAGNYVTLKAEVEKSNSATTVIALSAQDSNNRVVIGIL